MGTAVRRKDIGGERGFEVVGGVGRLCGLPRPRNASFAVGNPRVFGAGKAVKTAVEALPAAAEASPWVCDGAGKMSTMEGTWCVH